MNKKFCTQELKVNFYYFNLKKSFNYKFHKKMLISLIKKGL